MLAFLFDAALLSLRQPRRGLRLVLDNIQGPQGALILLGLALVSVCIIVAAQWILFGPPEAVYVPEGTPENAPAPTLPGLVQGIVLTSALSFAMICAFVFGLGRAFGGKGDLTAVAVTLAWHSLLTAPMVPFLDMSAMAQPGGPDFWRVDLLMYSTWLLICFIAEVHRFASAWRVGAAILGLVFVLSLIVLVSLSGA